MVGTRSKNYNNNSEQNSVHNNGGATGELIQTVQSQQSRENVQLNEVQNVGDRTVQNVEPFNSDMVNSLVQQLTTSLTLQLNTQIYNVKQEPKSDFQNQLLQVQQQNQVTQRQSQDFQFVNNFQEEESETVDQSMTEASERNFNTFSNNHINNLSNTVQQEMQAQNQPQTVVQIPDVVQLQPKEDLILFFKKFENSYLGLGTDKQKIFRCVNKMTAVDDVYQTACSLLHFNSYTHFKNRILKIHGKTKREIMLEFESMQKYQNESISCFVDRLVVKLSTLNMNQGLMIAEIWQKLPSYYKKNISRVDLSNIASLKREVKLIENDQLHRQMQECLQFLEVSKGSNFSNQQQSSDTNTQRNINQNFQTQNQNQNFQYRNRQNNNRNFNNRSNQDFQKQNLNVKQEQQPSWVKQEQQPSWVNSQINRLNNKEQQGPSQQNLYVNVNEEVQEQEEIFNEPTFTFDQNTEQYQNFFQNIDAFVHDYNLRPRAPARNVALNSGQSQVNVETTSQNSLNSTTQQTPQISQERNSSEMETDQQNNTSTQTFQQVSTNNQLDQRQYRYFNPPQETLSQIQANVLKARLNKECDILLDPNIFSTPEGNLEFTRLMQSIKYPMSLYDLQRILEQTKRGNIPIYFNSMQNQVQILLNEVQNQDIVQKSIQRVSQLGSHLYVNISLYGQKISAIVDTGAVKTIVSEQVIQKLNLQNNLQIYTNQPSLAGITGEANLLQYAKNAKFSFLKFHFFMDLPVVSTNQFQLLIGQDILQNYLRNCVISLKENCMYYDINVKGQLQQIQMKFTSQPNQFQLIDINTSQQVIQQGQEQKVEEVFPHILSLNLKFDLALIDFPLSYPEFFGSYVKFDTVEDDLLLLFKHVLDFYMQKNSHVLIWGSAKKLEFLLKFLKISHYKFLNFLLVWVKLNKSNDQVKKGLGFWSRNSVEFLLIGTKGSFSKFKSQKKDVGQVFFTLCDQSASNKHSSKPLKVYDLLNDIYDLKNLNAIEFFARPQQSQIQQQYFTLYGQEIDNWFQLSNSVTTDIPVFVNDVKITQTVLDQFLPHNYHEIFIKFLDQLDMDIQLKSDQNILRVLMQNFEVFDISGHVGLAKNIQLELKVKKQLQPFPIRNMKLQGPQREFLQKTIDEWLQKQYIKPGFTPYVYYPVFIPRSDEKRFRLCYNFQPLNENLHPQPFQTTDIEGIINNIQQDQVFCIIDLSAAHNQIGVKSEFQHMLGLWTPWGIYLAQVGMFGMLDIAKIFSKGLLTALGDLIGNGVQAYADDIIIHAQDMSSCLNLLEITLHKLKDNGYCLGASKCKLFKTTINILGQTVSNGTVTVQKKKIEALEKAPLPQTKTQLQQFIGIVTAVRKFIPNLATILKPLYTLLQEQQQQQQIILKENHVIIINKLKQILLTQPVLQLPDFSKLFYIQISFNSYGFGAVLCQKSSNVLKPVAFRSTLMSQEQSLKPQIIYKLESLKQALNDWQDIIKYKKIIILTDNKLLKNALFYKGESTEINKYLSEFLDYHIECQIKTTGVKALRMCEYFLPDLPYANLFQDLDDLLTEQEKNTQKNTNQTNTKTTFYMDFNKFELICFFDGACSRKSFQSYGTGAFVIYTKQGILFEEASQIFSQETITNNFAEYNALFMLIKYLHEQNQHYTHIQIVGDSQLVVKQLQGIFRINNNALRSIKRNIQLLLKQFKNLTIVNVKRQFNEKANALAQDKMKSILKKDLQSAVNFQTFIVKVPDYVSEIFCVVCGSTHTNETMYICDHCGRGQHETCLGEKCKNIEGYFYCFSCENEVLNVLKVSNVSDLSQNHKFLEFLENQNVSLSTDERARYQQLSRYYQLSNNQLFYLSEKGPLQVPSLSNRALIILQIHQQLGHPGYLTTFHHIKEIYWWPNMQANVQQVLKRCLICQAKRQNYLPPITVTPTFKGVEIWQFISVDLIEIHDLEKTTFRYVLCCICAYSKAPELIVLENKSSSQVAQAFRDNVIFRYGNPLCVRSDGGTEFKGDFQLLLQRFQILHVTTSPYYPQSNGLIERLNRQIKSKLQSLFNSLEYSDLWVNLIQAIAFAIRVSVSRATGFSPFQIMFGRDPLIPGHNSQLSQDNFRYQNEQELATKIQKFLDNLQYINQKVSFQLSRMDQEIQQTIEARTVLKLTNLSFMQSIFVKSQNETKLNLKEEGPCYFIRYTNDRKDILVYYNPRTKRFNDANIQNIKLCNN